MGCFLSPSHHFFVFLSFFCLFVFLSFCHISWLVYIPQFMIEYMINSQHMNNVYDTLRDQWRFCCHVSSRCTSRSAAGSCSSQGRGAPTPSVRILKLSLLFKMFLFASTLSSLSRLEVYISCAFSRLFASSSLWAACNWNKYWIENWNYLHQVVHLREALQAHEQVDWGATAASGWEIMMEYWIPQKTSGWTGYGWKGFLVASKWIDCT